jgi:hypothetical protein
MNTPQSALLISKPPGDGGWPSLVWKSNRPGSTV